VPDITSRQHPIVRAFKAAARAEHGTALLDGWHLLHDAAAAGIELISVAFTAAALPSQADAALLDQLAQRCDVFTVTAPVMDAMSPVRTPAGVVAIAKQRLFPFEQLLQPAPPLIVTACDLQDPGNAGAVIRSAEAANATGVLLCGASADPWSWKALRAAMGSTFRLPVHRMRDTPQAMARLRDAHIALVATVPRGAARMSDIDLSRATAIILGGEGGGLPPAVLDTADQHLSIPMRAPVESLNVAVAAALLVYEARRQREA
jgi:TrmH family RNA methyltransferase